MKPYFETELGRLYLGDCREIMPQLAKEDFETVITDPVWPNALISLEGSDNPYKLFATAAKIFCKKTKRVIVHLGCSSDVRFLRCIPKRLPFIRTCWLRYNFPSRRGRILVGSDVAYAFGTPPKSRKGHHLLSGECNNKDVCMSVKKKQRKHPCPRKIEHVRWLVNQYAEKMVLDPFVGSGKTAVACEQLGIKWVGIEINKQYCDYAAQEIDNEARQYKMRLRGF